MVACHYNYKLGDSNAFGQHYVIKYALFEPSLFKMNINNPVEQCLKSIHAAFTMKNRPSYALTRLILWTILTKPTETETLYYMMN